VHGDPVNGTDPTGKFLLGSVGFIGTLATIGTNLHNSVQDVAQGALFLHTVNVGLVPSIAAMQAGMALVAEGSFELGFQLLNFGQFLAKQTLDFIDGVDTAVGVASLGVIGTIGFLKLAKSAPKLADGLLDAVRGFKGQVQKLFPEPNIYNLALGLSQHPEHLRSGLLMRFADNVDDTNVQHYWQIIDELGLPNAAVGKELEQQLLNFMSDSKRIHFNLDGMLDTLDPGKLQDILELGAQGTRVPQNITRWEFRQVWTKHRGKAKFYFEGKPVDLSGLLQ